MNRSKLAVVLPITALLTGIIRTCAVVTTQSGPNRPEAQIRQFANHSETGQPAFVPRTDVSDGDISARPADSDGDDRVRAAAKDPLPDSRTADTDRAGIGRPVVLDLEHGQRPGIADASAAVAATNGEGTEEEPELRIVQISVSQEYAENIEIVMANDAPRPSQVFSGGFDLRGNKAQIPCCLMVRALDRDGTEFVQYLPWDYSRPNRFESLSAMYGCISVAVYDGARLMGRFLIAEDPREDTVCLDLKSASDTRMASL